MEALDVGDGVTNVALSTATLLRELGEQGTINARFVAPPFALDTRPRYEVLGAPGAGLLFHYWNYNTSTWIVHAIHGRRAIYYHGITPPRFFAAGSELRRMTAEGYAQIRALADCFDLVIGTSRHTLAEVCGFLTRPRPAVHLYPLVDREECWRAPLDGALLESLRSTGDVNLVFVGRIVSNKRQDRLLRLFDHYHRRNPRSRLFLVGNDASDPAYRAELGRLRGTLASGPHVTLTGKVSERALHAYLRAADVFVCASEHEGFCIPVAQAMALDVPVVALAAAAVPETLGRGGIAVERWDDEYAADLVHRLITDPMLRAQVIARQRQALTRFSAAEVRARLEAVVTFLNTGTWSPLFAWSHEVVERERNGRWQTEA
jgi:glycosyltransferase involved in cell wall biosynthesis